MPVPAILPLLGLLGLGVGSFAQPHVENYQNKVRGKYAGGLLDGVDPNNPNQTRDALFGGGLLSGPDFQGDSRTGFEGIQSRDAAMARQRVSSGPGYAAAALAREKWGANIANPNAPNYQDPNAPYDPLKDDVFGRTIALNEYARDNPAVFDQSTDAGFAQWRAQQDFLRENPSFSDQTARMNANNAQVQLLASQAALAEKFGVDTANAYVAEVEPLMRVQDTLAEIRSTIPQMDNKLWGNWLQTTSGSAAKELVERRLFELRQDWINQRVSPGREPSITLQEEADKRFRVSAGVFDSRDKLGAFLSTLEYDNQREIERANKRFAAQRAKQPTQVLGTYGPEAEAARSGTTNTGKAVVPD